MGPHRSPFPLLLLLPRGDPDPPAPLLPLQQDPVLATAPEPPEDPRELAPGLTWSGSLRLRGEVRRDFSLGTDSATNNDDFLLSQIRLGLKWRASDEVSFFLEGQDADIHGEDGTDGDAVPNAFADELDFHQGYVDLGGGPARLRVGRQKLLFGVQRIIGPLEWTNTARVWDGARLSIGAQEERAVDLFATRLVAVDPSSLNDGEPTGNRHADSDFHGVYATDRTLLPRTTLDLYGLLRHEDDFDDEVYTAGARADASFGALSLDAEIAVQLGTFGGLDHRAAAVHVGGNVAVSGETRLGLQYNFGSGDADGDDGDHGTFDNLYPTNHLFYGQMDLFSLQNLHNAEASLSGEPAPDLAVKLAWDAFWLAQEDEDAWYNAALGVVRSATGDADPYVGSELDLTVSRPLLGGRMVLELGYGHFFAGAFVDDTGRSEDADFLYLQARVGL